MIEISDVQKAVVERLENAGNTVTANEVEEGFDKPTCFVDAFPSGITAYNQFYDEITVSVEIKYAPAVETREELLKKINEFKIAFKKEPLKIADRVISVDSLTFEIDKPNLICYFDIEFMQENDGEISEYDVMENLNIREDVE